MRVPTVEARPAATTILLRDTRHGGIEVLMVRRSPNGFFGGLTVFPGGAVDPEDHSQLAEAVVPGAGADRIHRVAALRELAEETGIALTDGGMLPAPSGRGIELFRSMHRAGLRLDASALTVVSRWVTPESAPKRFDTMFYVARAVDAPEIQLDTSELVEHMWVAPSLALDRYDSGSLKMFHPTIAHLRWLRECSSVDDSMASATGADRRSLLEPRRTEDGALILVNLPVES
ncbi:MAG: NUDIX hydrolase [Acidimicrobiia bacterium]